MARGSVRWLLSAIVAYSTAFLGIGLPLTLLDIQPPLWVGLLVWFALTLITRWAIDSRIGDDPPPD